MRSKKTGGVGQLEMRRELVVAPLLCVINGTTREGYWSSAAVRAERWRITACGGSGCRFARTSSVTPAPSSWRRESVSLIVRQRQLGDSCLDITSVYLQGIDSREIIEGVHARRAPMIPVSASLRLWSTALLVARSDGPRRTDRARPVARARTHRGSRTWTNEFI